MPRRGVTASDLIEELETNPARRQAEIDRELFRQQTLERRRRAAVPVVADLRRHGYAVDSISDLFNSRMNYRAVIPVLIHWLPLVEDPAVKEDIARALAVPWARPAAGPVLLAEFKGTSSEQLRWALANSLAVVAADDLLPEMLPLVQDVNIGKPREMLVLALGNMRDQSATQALINLLHDEQVVGHALMALKRQANPDAARDIEPLLKHPKTWVRREAKAALAKIARPQEGV